MHNYQPTNDELKHLWKQAGLWRGGHTFEEDIKIPVIRMCLVNAAISYHKKHQTPAQGQLNLENNHA